MFDFVPGINGSYTSLEAAFINHQCCDLSPGSTLSKMFYFIRRGATAVKHISHQLGRLLGIMRRATRVQV